MEELSQKELDERVAILRHFRKLLEQQRAKFQEYLNVLEKQESSITSENADALIAHTEIEQEVVKSISNLQKVIVPMQKMYIAANPESDKEIVDIQNELSTLQTKVLEQNEKNRELLKCHITELRTRISSLQNANPYRNAASVYASSAKNSGHLITVEV
ncbi:MAG: flagellar biosynthesis protein FlgN [Treponema sp.]|nr:flagellar biosynthesis protein FlgN [Treponema sp.]